MFGALEVVGPDANKLVHLIDRAIEQYVVVGHVEMAVIVDPLRLDMHQRRDERREENRIEVGAVEHGSGRDRIDRFFATEDARDVARALSLQLLERFDRVERRVRGDDDVVAAKQR